MTTTGTKTLLTRSPSRWILARLVCARCTVAMIWANAVSSPVALTRITRLPSRLTVPANNCAPAALSTGADSPVSIDSSTAEPPSITMPSVGTCPPGLSTTRSPVFNCATGTSRSVPLDSRRRATEGARSSSFRSALEARAATRDSIQCPVLIKAMIADDSMK